MDDIVCVTLTNGVKIPVLGYSLPKKNQTCHLSLIERAIDVGYRHVSIDSRKDRDIRIGKYLRSMLDQESLSRTDICISMKVGISDDSITTARSHFTGRLDTLQCEYIDLLLVDYTNREYDNCQEKFNEVCEETWHIFEELRAEGLIRSLGLSADSHIMLLNVLQQPTIAPDVIMTTDESPIVQKYLPNLIKLCGRREIQPIIQITEYYQNGLMACRHGKLLSAIAKEMQRGTDQILLRSFLERGLPMISKTNSEEILERSFQILDFSLFMDDLRQLVMNGH